MLNVYIGPFINEKFDYFNVGCFADIFQIDRVCFPLFGVVGVFINFTNRLNFVEIFPIVDKS